MVINSIWAVLKVKTGQLVEKSRKLMQGMRAAVPLSQNALPLSQVYSLKQISVEMSSGKKKNYCSFSFITFRKSTTFRAQIGFIPLSLMKSQFGLQKLHF